MKAGHNQTRIAEVVGCHGSTTSRQVRRSRGRRGYRPEQAHDLPAARRLAVYRPRLTPATWALVESSLRREWSPEQIAGRRKLEGRPAVSHERLYRYVYADGRAGGTLHLPLRWRRVRRKRYGKHSRRGQLPHCVSIEARPAVVGARRRIGDWEADTVIGAGRRCAILSLTERKPKLVRLRLLGVKGAEEVTRASPASLSPLSGKVHTITSDDGGEFAHHERSAAGLGARFYFAHPYASRERGLNENTNGLVRQYFPKKRDFTAVRDAEVEHAVGRRNNGPRKRPGSRTPNEVFFKQPSVALQT